MPSEEITYENLKKFGRSYLTGSAKVSLFLDNVFPESQNCSFHSSAGLGHLNGEAE